MQMVEVEPHEELKAKGLVIEFDKNLGNAAFVSHQWLGRDTRLRNTQGMLVRLGPSNLHHCGGFALRQYLVNVGGDRQNEV